MSLYAGQSPETVSVTVIMDEILTSLRALLQNADPLVRLAAAKELSQLLFHPDFPYIEEEERF